MNPKQIAFQQSLKEKREQRDFLAKMIARLVIKDLFVPKKVKDAFEKIDAELLKFKM